jgi:uncharacterized protein YacL
MTKKAYLIIYKVFFALLGFSALVTEVATLVERGTFNSINFFSFFTVQVNTLVVIVFLISAIFLALNKSKKLDNLRSATTVLILMVGIGFALLLAGLEGVALTAVPWDNTVLHYIIPVAVLVDFIIDSPQTKQRFKKLLIWLVYPAAYVTYTLIRGATVGWYPYPFLNPANSSYAQVLVAVAGLFELGITLFALAAKCTGKRALATK